MARELCEDKSRDMVSSSAGFCYSEVSSGSGNPMIQTQMVNQIPGFVSDSDTDVFNLSTGMEMIGFSKNLQAQQQTDTNPLMWKSFIAKTGGPSSSSKTTNFYHHQDYHKPDFASAISETSSDNLIVASHDPSAPWQDNNRLLVDDSSLRCVFTCEGNERPSQGLSLSLSSTNPSSIGLQSFELRQTNHHLQNQHDLVSSTCRDAFFGKTPNSTQQQQQMLQDGYLGKSAANLYHGQGHFLLKNSKYLVPAQELLNEFCSLGTNPSDVLKQKSQKNKQWEEDSGSSSSKKHVLSSLEFAELQKRKTKLLSMLEEVDRRYRHYCNQMKAVVSSFEAVAGHGAAAVYSALALKAMSRHFRCLKDGILSQIQATRKAMGEKDPIAPGTTKGETPRLKIIDQAIRQQKAFQQMSMMESHPWRPQRGLPERSVSVLRAWLFEHFLHPYPSDVDKHILARQTGLSRSQVSNWFINARVRLWKPMVEEMYLEEVKERENNMDSSKGVTDPQEDNPSLNRPEDEKPTPGRLVRIDSECVSSIVNNSSEVHKDDPFAKSSKTLQNHHHIQQDQCMGRVTDTFGSMELDFSSYTTANHHSAGMVSYANDNFNAGGVSLTLGLQQHGGNGVSLAFPPPTHGSLFYPREQMEDCQPVQYSLLDGEGQNLPYRNLMGAQLLHDLAG
ncbi:hypothetical protein L6164_028258 [Bauhinia variegata]|uniref:Uncharacterized protein n=1 Tax=Bauhinia variegata TaxID=167791 RepID=A0ACB9LVN0_BAUVA|nr:hypothetical protein L6164_028258 [Bauhinia variegata]